MNREEYLNELKKYLRRLPKDDYENAIEYFTEYFEDAGSEHEADAIRELGSPREAAADLLGALLDEKSSAAFLPKPVSGNRTSGHGQTADGQSEPHSAAGRRYRAGDPFPEGRQDRSALSILLIVCLSIFAAPIALPLAIATVVLLLAGVIVVLSIVIAAIACSASMVIVGVYSIVKAFAILSASVPGFLLVAGCGLLSTGLGILLLLASLFFGKWLITWLARLIQKMISKRRVNSND